MNSDYKANTIILLVEDRKIKYYDLVANAIITLEDANMRLVNNICEFDSERLIAFTGLDLFI